MSSSKIDQQTEDLLSEINDFLENRRVRVLFTRIMSNKEYGPKILEFITRHRDFFEISENFSDRALILDIPDEINSECFSLIEDHLNLISNERKSLAIIEKFSRLFILVLAFFIREIISQEEFKKMIERQGKPSLNAVERKVKDILEKSHQIIALDDESKDRLIESVRDLLKSNPEYYFSILFPKEMIDTITSPALAEKRNKFRKYQDVIELLEQLNVVFTAYTAYLCDNAKSHDVDSPPFFLFVLPHLKVPKKFDESLKCPFCEARLKKIKILGFIPPFSKIILNNEMLRYFIIFFLDQRGFNWRLHPGNSNVGEIDLLVIKNEKAVAIEVKQHVDSDRIETIASHIDGVIEQLKKRVNMLIKIGDDGSPIHIVGGIGILNHRKSEINKALNRIQKVKRKLEQNNMIKLLSFEEFDKIPEILSEFLK